ncbi:redox-regulated ATPase YchF [Candidatus Peregrinibacteria bacterium]|nr:redox-regulated ATPase YchF [Candidatus Peregrinibacteria bacterium]
MSLNIGIVGLPNVGKSTIFNALTKTAAAQAENYPFCTIDPNVGIVEVPDKRLHQLAEVSGSEKIIPATIKFVDIAGLVKGASKGEGLGNKFLSHIRECEAIAHVIRAFSDSNITHVHGEIEPGNDKDIIESELLISDTQTVEKRLEKARTEAKSGDKEKKSYLELIDMVSEKLNEGVLANEIELNEEQKELISDLHLLTMKPNLYIVNLHEDDIAGADRKEYAKKLGLKSENQVILISAKVEQELIGFDEQEAKDYLKDLGLEAPGLHALIKSAYETLGLITYFTSGPKETHAWTVRKGASAPKAAGVIHTDFEKGFIKAEVINWEDFVNCGSEISAKEKGLLRIEGKEYLVKDGDVIHFRFNT